MSEKETIKSLITAVEHRCRNYLQDEMELPVKTVEHAPQQVKSLTLKDMTALVSLGGSFNVYIAFSFEMKVMKQIFNTYTADIEIDPDEEDMYIEETAGDVINTVIGNAMAEIPEDSVAISLTPPVVLPGARNITRHKDAYFFMTDFITELGTMSVMYIGPMKFFTTNLDLKVD
ncbi:chemotaxis protein CheX [Desulfovibrio sp. JC010]|uniref:chemotaxis protein CheX n=1 Tax=Desulfovibrio sp. JC010 TaxID=2593641 RepID=UPI0013D57CF1|nr:chemotaxis protein CheX [Desulfovibrio sp. JC010]NDV25613.1 chemotaxis protein CheX [Desulfovibrio sp. JC010]